MEEARLWVAPCGPGKQSGKPEPGVTARDTASASHSQTDQKLWLTAAAQHHESGSKHIETGIGSTLKTASVVSTECVSPLDHQKVEKS